ncbi:MAG: FAD-binding oxidoreductase [Sphingomonadales bacterium]|nr:FAD-binding oxidoreductase [Sphingomonadales bacterium]MBK9002670.1 FAD-binding oxidoreductase [Sphingomonadales bacterium]MBK9267892.1 FAD-binding oxidoreductase [Sphingomonadales bacterium]MBP6434636.1 FAD-binding oxidoreductase [Sphingorhabdus sp.]
MPDNVIFERLGQILGPKGFVINPAEIAPWTTDWRGRYTGRAAALLAPASTEEVSEIVKLANVHRLALVPQGGNSGMVAGATPDGTGESFLLSLRRMNRIEEVDVQSKLVRCEAGVILQNLHDAVAESGLRFPLTLGGKGSATVGGLISTNAGGTQVLRHGTMRNLVAGIEAVLPDGSVFNALAPLKKDNRGYDLKHLLIGAEGTIGVVTRATLHLVPALLERAVAWVAVDSPSAAYELLLAALAEFPAALEGFEILPNAALDHVLKHIPGTRPPLEGAYGWHIVMELAKDRIGQDRPSLAAEQFLGKMLEDGLARNAVVAANEAQAEVFWKIRDSIAEAERAEGPALQHDISVPVASMARFIEQESPDIAARYPGTSVVAFGHLGDGNIHYHVKAPAGVAPDNWYAEYSARISADVYDRVTQYGGSISAEHGIGQAKLAEFVRLSDPARLTALRGIKAALDPLGIMNPGKLVPLASKPASA